MRGAAARAAALLSLAAALARPAPVRAQSPATALDAARAQLENLNVDSAAVLLRRVSDPSARATPSQRALGRILRGVGELILGREARARTSFQEALGLDPLVRVDSLASLHSDLVRVFEAVRAGPVALVVLLPADTVLPPEVGSLRIGVRTSRRVPLSATIAQDGEGGAAVPPVYRDSQTVGGAALFSWRPGAATTIPTGTFTLRVVALDPAGGGATPPAAFAASLLVERVVVDTAPLPPPLEPAALLPESVQVRARRPQALLVGVAFGAAAATLATLGPEGSGSGADARAFVVGGAISLGGIAGFLSGGVANRPIRHNVATNRAARAANAAARDSVTQVNAERKARAGVRIVVTPR